MAVDSSATHLEQFCLQADQPSRRYGDVIMSGNTVALLGDGHVSLHRSFSDTPTEHRDCMSVNNLPSVG